MLKTLPRETRTIQSQLCKRPLERLLANDLKLHTVSEQYSTMLRIAAKDYGEKQQDEKDMSMAHHYRYATTEHDAILQAPIRNWDEIREDMVKWGKESGYQEPDERFK